MQLGPIPSATGSRFGENPFAPGDIERPKLEGVALLISLGDTGVSHQHTLPLLSQTTVYEWRAVATVSLGQASFKNLFHYRFERQSVFAY
jgi:hypothetical protein